MKVHRKFFSAALVFVGFVVCTPIAIVLMSNETRIRVAVILQEPTTALTTSEWVQERVPGRGSSDLVIFGKNGITFLAGGGRLLVSRDQGKTWSKLEGGDGYYRITADGGRTYRYSERNKASSAWIGIGELCTVEAGAITNSGRLYLSAVCEHTTQVWSIPTSASGPWFVTGFTYDREPSDGVYTPKTDLIARKNLVAVTGNMPGVSAILTTDDEGFSWRPLSKEYDSTRIRAFDFLDDQQGVLLVSNGELLMTGDGGKSWTPVVAFPTDIAKRANSIRFASTESLLIAGKQGMILVSKDRCLTWRAYSIEPSINWSNIVPVGDGRAWISGNSNVVIETRDLGQSWLRAMLPSNRDVYSGLTSDGNHAWVASDEFLLHSPAPKQ